MTASTVLPEPLAATPLQGQKEADVFVVFGITGDLAKVMTFRSLYRLERRGLLDCPIVGVAVDDWSVDQLIDRARLPNEIALGSIPWQTGRMIGPSITGILIAAFGGTVGFGLAAIASCAALALYTRIRVSEDIKPSDGRAMP